MKFSEHVFKHSDVLDVGRGKETGSHMKAESNAFTENLSVIYSAAQPTYHHSIRSLALMTDKQELLTLDLASTAVRSKRHGSPQEGVSLAAATELRGKPVRDAVAALASGIIRENLEEVFSQTFSVQAELERNVDSLPVRCAWNLVLICLTARSSGKCLPRCGIHEAEIWFRGGLQTTTAWLSAKIPAESSWQAEQLLNGIQLDSEFQALLPYILEEHGPGSRASVMKPH